MIPRSLRKLLCLWLVAVLLSAQTAVASHACPGMTGATTLAAAATDVDDDDAANLCVEHCRVGQQSADHAASPAVAPAILLPLYTLAAASGATPHATALRTPDALLAAPPPPHTILHCCLRT